MTAYKIIKADKVKVLKHLENTPFDEDIFSSDIAAKTGISPRKVGAILCRIDEVEKVGTQSYGAGIYRRVRV